ASAGARAAARAAARTGVVTMPPVLSLPLPAQPWPRGPQPVAATRPTVQPVVRWALYLFICSIPFEMPQRSLPIEIPTLVGCVFLLATLLDRRAAYRRIDVPLVAFTGYLWMFAVAALALTNRQGRRWPAVVRWPLVVLIAVAVVQTGSRGGLLALCAGLLTFLGREPTRWARVRNGVAALTALGVLGFTAYHSEGMRNR